MKKQLEELWKNCENLKATGYFHPSHRQIKKEDIFINKNIPTLTSILDSPEAFIIEGWILLQTEKNNDRSIYIFRENDEYQIKEFNIEDLNKEEDTAFIQEYKFIADDLIKKITGINSIKMNKVYKKIKNEDGIYKIKPTLFYFNGFE